MGEGAEGGNADQVTSPIFSMGEEGEKLQTHISIIFCPYYIIICNQNLLFAYYM